MTRGKVAALVLLVALAPAMAGARDGSVAAAQAASASQGCEADRMGKGLSFGQRLVKIFLDLLRPACAPPVALKSKSGIDAPMIVGASTAVPLWVLQSERPFELPWYSATPSRISVARRAGDDMLATLATADGTPGRNHIRVPHALGQVGTLEITIIQSDATGTPVRNRFAVRVIPADAGPALPADAAAAARSAEQLDLIKAAMLSLGYDLCYMESVLPECAQGRLQSFQYAHALANEAREPDVRAAAGKLAEQLLALRQ